MRDLMKRHILILAAAGLIAAVLPSCEKERDEGSSRSVDMIVLFSSDLLGRIRSCGCAVEDMGGLGRMATYIEKMRSRYPNAIVLDAGDAFSLDLSFSKAEADLTWDVYGLMGLDAFTPGETDFIFGLSYLEGLSERTGVDILAANVVDGETGDPVFGLPFKIVELEGGLRVGITGVLDDTIRFPGYIDTESFDVIPVREALNRIVPEMEQEADFLILLSHLGRERSIEIAAEVPAFDLVIAGHGQPVIKETKKVGETIIVATGTGKYMGRVNLTLSDKGEHLSGTYSLVPLEEDIAIHDEVKALFDFYGLTLTDKEEKKRKH
jgi:2',3'-cyclic-nucleotide 2'-phosphodiesterase/3'-nucleotidase